MTSGAQWCQRRGILLPHCPLPVCPYSAGNLIREVGLRLCPGPCELLRTLCEGGAHAGVVRTSVAVLVLVVEESGHSVSWS